MVYGKKFLVLIFFTLLHIAGRGQSSVLSTGNWFKVAVEKHGVYKITHDDLRRMGFDPGSVDPRNIKIFGQEGGMLPQLNTSPYPKDLVELSIHVEGESDGIFNPSDYIVFYAQGANRIAYHTQQKSFQVEQNLYSTKNFYFITTTGDRGKRIISAATITGGTPIHQFDDYIYYETDKFNRLKSGREWFGEKFELASELVQTFAFSVPGILENTAIKLVSDVMAESLSSSSFKLYYNNNLVSEQNILPIPNSTYGVKGRQKRDTLVFNVNQVSAHQASRQEIRYEYVRPASGSSAGYLNYFLINVKRRLSQYSNPTFFRSVESLAQSLSEYHVVNAAPTSRVWEITNFYEPVAQPASIENGLCRFTSTSEVLKAFVIFDPASLPAVELVEKVENQNLHSLSTPQLVVITHPDFLQEARRLAQHREQHSGWTTAVVTTQQVFNAFSSGRQDISAIRNFIKFLYDKNPGVLKALLLFGKGSYDYKNRVPSNTNFVPTYQSRNSLSPLESYSSDDYYGFLEDHEGLWLETAPVQNHSLDIAVGRLPVKTLAEAKIVVDKIIHYDTNSKTWGSWRKQIVFIADDGSISDGFTSIHQAQANALAEVIEAGQPAIDNRKIFLGTYRKTVAGNGERIPQARKDIIESFERGSVIINYTGHGNEKIWADERVFSDDDIYPLKNDRYPFLVTATCEFGKNDDPAFISSAELSIIQEKGGSIGLVTTARPVNSSTNFSLNQAFYNALFQRESNQLLPIGEVFRRTKNNSLSGVSNRNFSLLGDPSLTLALPTASINIQQVKTLSGSDTLKALSTVVVKGFLESENGMTMTGFNGTLEATLFDKKTDFVTIGRNNPPYTFQQWHNPLFKGKATVKHGEFEFRFVLPKNIAYAVAAGKLTLYAYDATLGLDAAGASTELAIGGTEPNAPIDQTSPRVQAFMGDTTFVNGGLVTPNTMLVARVKDESGLNISNFGIGNTMVAVLDNDAEVFLLNDYFIADTDDFTKGWIHFPMKDLPPGQHTLTVKVWDTHNNPAQTTIDFIVTDGNFLVIESFGNAPNPFQDRTHLFFTHNRSGDDLQAQVAVYTPSGQLLQTYQITVEASPYQVNLLELNALGTDGKKLHPGLYLARLVVRSLTNGSKSERVTKLIVLN